MKSHPGINMSSFSVDGLPGLLMAITIVFMGVGMFVPAVVGAVLLPIWVITAGGAAIWYTRAQKRDNRNSERIARAWRELNGKGDDQ